MSQSKNEQTTIEDLSFEVAFQQLQETVEKLEAGNLPLQEAMTLYQKGTALARYCGVQLDQAELSLKQLTPEGDLLDFDEH